MKIVRIEGCTRELGKPPDWTEDQQCDVLPIRDVVTSDGPFMVSAWELTKEEIAELQAGKPLNLWIHGKLHPVVGFSIGDIG